MSNPQETAEKSVQTQDSSGTVFMANNPENTAAEVANTLVSMATGRQRLTPVPVTIKQSNVINVPNPLGTAAATAASSLPILHLADYTTSRGVPTASALANQAKLTPKKMENSIENNHDDTSMSTEDYGLTRNENISTKKSSRGKKLTMKNKESSSTRAIQYGPILVKPRKRIAPTLSSGRKSKDEPLPPEEDIRRKLRRDRNKQAAAKCRQKRNELREELEKTEQLLTEQQLSLQNSVDTLNNQKQQLEYLLTRHACLRKNHLPTTNSFNLSKTDVKTIPINPLLDPNSNKRVTINLTNAQDLFTLAPLARSTFTTENSSASASASSSTVPMITIHIIPEVAQALLGSTSVDKNKLAELLQQANTINLTSSSSITTTTTNNNNNNNNTHLISNTTNSNN